MIWLSLGMVVMALIVLRVVFTLLLPGQARKRFAVQREQLHADFFAAAAASGKPRGLSWKSLDWAVSGQEPEPVLARDLETGLLVGLVPVIIQFEAIQGSDMEGLPAVSNLRNASAVFHYFRGGWHTKGKAVFNLNPDETLVHFKSQYSPLSHRSPPAKGNP